MTNFDLSLGLIAFGEHAGASDGPDDEPIGGLTLFFAPPGDTVQFNQPTCSARITFYHFDNHRCEARHS